jgi:hypothetical protein
MRWSAALIALALPSLALAEGTSTTTATQRPLPCESQTPRPERRDIRCALSTTASTTASAQRYRFKAHFSGSHDDTTASLTPTLDGKPLACDASSKTQTEGEEGDVSLECRFSITQSGSAAQAFRVVLAWHHAQYMAFELMPE